MKYQGLKFSDQGTGTGKQGGVPRANGSKIPGPDGTEAAEQNKTPQTQFESRDVSCSALPPVRLKQEPKFGQWSRTWPLISGCIPTGGASNRVRNLVAPTGGILAGGAVRSAVIRLSRAIVRTEAEPRRPSVTQPYPASARKTPQIDNPNSEAKLTAPLE